MCSQANKRRIHNLNRCLIVLLSLLGFSLDGLQLADGFFITSILLWLWQKECDELEAIAMDLLNQSPCTLVGSFSKQ